MPDKAAVSGKTFALNDMRMRTVTFLKVKVYVIGRYLSESNLEQVAAHDS